MYGVFFYAFVIFFNFHQDYERLNWKINAGSPIRVKDLPSTVPTAHRFVLESVRGHLSDVTGYSCYL